MYANPCKAQFLVGCHLQSGVPEIQYVHIRKHHKFGPEHVLLYKGSEQGRTCKFVKLVWAHLFMVELNPLFLMVNC